jgi:hypothetical protein
MVSTILANLEGCQERVLAGRLPISENEEFIKMTLAVLMTPE